MSRGRDIILNMIKKQAKGLIIGGSILGGIPLLLLIVVVVGMIGIIMDEGAGSDAAIGLMILSGALLIIGLLGVLMFVIGFRRYKDPYKNNALKTNPDLLFMADELYNGINYQDDNLMMSDRVIANKKNPLQMAFYNEIFMVYVHTESYNFITTTKQLVLATARDEIIIGIYGMKSEKVNHIAETVAAKCPYARFGYTQDNLKYLEEMRKVWKRAKLDQQMQNAVGQPQGQYGNVQPQMQYENAQPQMQYENAQPQTQYGDYQQAGAAYNGYQQTDATYSGYQQTDATYNGNQQ